MKKIGFMFCFIFLVGTGFAQNSQWYFEKGVKYYKAKNYSLAILYFKKVNELDRGKNSACQFIIGQCYDLAENYTQAFYWYFKAAEKGDAAAQCNLGTCYAGGLGIAKDDAQAVYWYRKAAEQGDGEAQGLLSLCYFEGTGVVKDLELAKFWARQAIVHTNPWMIQLLQELGLQ